MQKTILLAVFLMGLASCKVNRKLVEANLLNNYFELKDTISITILDYIPSCNCGVLMCASNCLGIDNKNTDTIRVLTLCNTDTIFKKGMEVKVIPQKKPEGQIKISTYLIVGGKETTIPNICKRKYPTTYGKLKRF